MRQKATDNFLNINKIFWHKHKDINTDNLLLVETSKHPVINHSNAVMAKIIAQAKNLKIAWLNYPYTSKPLMKSYSKNSVFINLPYIKPITKLYYLMLSIFYYFIYVFFINRLLSFSYNGIPYGDFVYDSYLAEFQMATLHRFDLKIIKIFYWLFIKDKEARELLGSFPVKAILVSHYIGLRVGVLSRVAMQTKIPVYWKGGGHEIINLAVFTSLKQIHDYPKKPSNETIDLLVKRKRKIVEADFNKLIKKETNNPYYGAFSVAYNKIISNKITRKSFLKNMSLENKPIVFVMLHAFNDFPHSHFKKMLFNDYYDWFVQTFRFAKKDRSKNWIFKEHPANKFYKTNDLNLYELMKNLPNNVKFVSQDSDVKASTVLKVADLIITCLGTAGVEMPALSGIPAMVGGDTFYDGLGFTIEPKSKKEYFRILKKPSFKKLSAYQQLRAKCCYLYLNNYCLVPFTSGPPITFEEDRNLQKLKFIYPKRILNTYKNKAKLIHRQFNEYVQELKKDNLQCLNNVHR